MSDVDVDVPVGEFTYDQEKQLLEKRANLWEQYKAEFKRGSEVYDEQKLDRIDNDIQKLNREIERGRKLRESNRADAEIVSERQDRTGTPADEHADLFGRWMRGNDLTREERMKLAGYTPGEFRVQQTLTGSGGGFLVPDGFWNRLVEQMLAYGPIEQFVNVISTGSGNDLPWTTMDDTSNEGELLNEGDQVSEQDLSFDVKVLRAHTYSSKLIRVSWQLMQDEVFDIEGLISRAAGIRLGRIHAKHFTIGDGVNKPDGITVGLSGGETLAAAANIDFEDLENIQHNIDPAYRTGNQRWMFSDAMLKLIRRVEGGTNQDQRAWQPALAAGVPDTVLGDPYVVNQSMPVPGSGNVSIIYGDLNRAYVVRRVRGATAVRLDEKYADYLQTGFFVYDRVDGTKDETSAYTYGVHP